MAKGKMPPEELLASLAEFKGTTQWYKHPLFQKFVYTDGARFLAVNAECYWLLEYIFSNQVIPEIKAEEFQRWELIKEGNEATITVGDGNGNVVKEFKIPFTDFPLDSFILWFVGNCLLLPSEY